MLFKDFHKGKNRDFNTYFTDSKNSVNYHNFTYKNFLKISRTNFETYRKAQFDDFATEINIQ